MNGDINALRIDVDNVLKNILPDNLLTALKTVDGTGSGLDADKLDGVELSTIYSDIYSKYDPVTLGNTINLNNCIETGIYYQNTGSYCSSALNYPVTDATGSGHLLVRRLNTGYIQQIYTTFYGHVYYRVYQDWAPVGWGAWIRSPVLKSGYVTVASVTANTIGTINTTISDMPDLNKLHVFLRGGTQGTVQVSAQSGTNYTFQYQFVATNTNRPISFMYYL